MSGARRAAGASRPSAAPAVGGSIRAMPRKIVVVGAGSTGFQLARQLVADNQDVTLIERDADTAKYALNNLDCMVINGIGNDLRLLRQAGIRDAEFFIALTDSDEFNMVVCGLASREFSVPFKIARVRNQQYYARSHLFDGSLLDIDYIVNPEIEAARAIVQTVEHGVTSEVVALADTDIEMRVLPIVGGSLFCDRTIAQTRAELPLEFLVCGLLRGERFDLPHGDTLVREGDELYVSASEEALDQLFDRAGRPKLRMRQVILVGGGRVGSFVAESLLDGRERRRRLRLLRAFGRKRRLKIIESDTARSKSLADRFPGAIVINGDISGEGFFEEESLGNHDLIITTTANQELNVLAAIFAKTYGIKRSIALVNKYNYLTLANRLGVDVIISPKNSVVSAVLKIVRRGRVRSVASLFGGQAEVIESTVDSSARMAGRSIREVDFPDQALIVSVRRDGVGLFPHGGLVMRDGDRLTIIARTDAIGRVEELFDS